jgi:hypothetical protein
MNSMPDMNATEEICDDLFEKPVACTADDHSTPASISSHCRPTPRICSSISKGRREENERETQTEDIDKYSQTHQ